MSPPRRSLPGRLGSLVLVAIFASLTGCQSVNIPMFSFGSEEKTYVGAPEGYGVESGMNQSIYNKVKEAKAQNSIVLQVVGDEIPARVLPLPPGQNSALVSELLEQTGVQAKLGAMDAVLYRQSPTEIGGIRLVVQMNSDKSDVRPESDYALHAGDRLVVQKAPYPGLQQLVDSALGL